MQQIQPASYSYMIEQKIRQPYNLESIGGTASLQSILPDNSPKVVNIDSVVGVQSERSLSSDSYDTLEKVVIQSCKKRTRTNSQEFTKKQAKCKDEILDPTRHKSFTALDSLSTSLTCRLKNYREMRVERSISSVVSPFKSKSQNYSQRFSSIRSHALKSSGNEQQLSSNSSSQSEKSKS